MQYSFLSRWSFLWDARCRTPQAIIPGTERAALSPLFDLAPDGVYRARKVTLSAVSSYLAFSPLPRPCTHKRSGVFSVALSVASRLLGVTQHPALWSSDFPLPEESGSDHPICFFLPLYLKVFRKNLEVVEKLFLVSFVVQYSRTIFTDNKLIDPPGCAFHLSCYRDIAATTGSVYYGNDCKTFFVVEYSIVDS